MGCDIHMHYEIKKDGKWELLKWQDKYLVGTYEDGSPKYDWHTMWDDPLEINRSYNLFAILANVRNGRGFAGIPTSTGFTPISMPRGLPDDVTPEVKEDSDGWDIDGHSHSWLTLKELLDFDWDGQYVSSYGVVGEEEYKVYKEQGRPKEWCGSIMGLRVENVSPERMEEVLSGNREPDVDYYTRVAWQWSYRESVGENWFKTLETLQTLGKPEDVRLVFWFDN